MDIDAQGLMTLMNRSTDCRFLGVKSLPAESPSPLYAAGNSACAAGDLGPARALHRRVLALQVGHVAARSKLVALLRDRNLGKP
jgi:hypothetical protein